MERYTSDGRRVQMDPGEVGKVDQLDAEFQDLTTRLLAIQARGIQLASSPPQDPTVTQGVRQLQADLFHVFDEAFIADGEPDKIFSFVMHLIGVLHKQLELETQVQQMVEELGRSVFNLAQKLHLTGGREDNP